MYIFEKKQNENNHSLKNLSKESITTALLILLKEKPYEDITISEICAKAGVSRNAFYRNYPAKDAILRVYLYEETDAWRRNLRKIENLTYIQYFTLLFVQFGKFKDLIRKMIQSNLTYLLIDLIFNFFRDFTRVHDKNNYYECHLAGSIYAIVTNWVMNERPEYPEEIAHLICKFNHIMPETIVIPPPPTSLEKMLTRSSFKYNN